MSANGAAKVIESALKEGRNCLSEYEAKQALAFYGIPVTREVLIDDVKELAGAAGQIGYPLVIKACASQIAHKTERGLVRTGIKNATDAEEAFREIKQKMGGGEGAILVQEMIQGRRELVMGMTRDEQFGPCVMFGLGGIFTEIFRDVSFRKAPIEENEAREMMREIRGNKILDDFRGMAAANVEMLARMLIGLGSIGLEFPCVREIDLNPVIISAARPVVVDALIVLG